MEQFFNDGGKLKSDYLKVSLWTISYRAFLSFSDWFILTFSLFVAFYFAILKYILSFFLDTMAVPDNENDGSESDAVHPNTQPAVQSNEPSNFIFVKDMGLKLAQRLREGFRRREAEAARKDSGSFDSENQLEEKTKAKETKAEPEGETKVKPEIEEGVKETKVETEEEVKETKVETEEEVKETKVETEEEVKETKVETEEEVKETKVEPEIEEGVKETKVETEEKVKETKVETEEGVKETKVETEEEVKETKVETEEEVKEAEN